MRKKKNESKRLQTLAIAQSVLLGALIQEMHDKGLIDGKKVLKEYEDNLENVVKELTI